MPAARETVQCRVAARRRCWRRARPVDQWRRISGDPMTSRPIWQWSAVETAAAIRAGRASAVEVASAHIDRLHAANPALNAVVIDMSGLALEAAHAADRRQAEGGELGSLHGVPVTIKINVD